MLPLCPADELSDIRAEIARLRARETVLCAAFLRDPEQGALGRWTKIDVVQHRELEFDIELLPENLRFNANFYRERVSQTVRNQPLPTALAPRPGWPIRRESAPLALH